MGDEWRTSELVPDSDLDKIFDVYDQAVSNGGKVFRDWGIAYPYKDGSPLMVTLGIISAEEYDIFFKDSAETPDPGDDLGQSTQEFNNRLAHGLGETNVSGTRRAEQELKLARTVFNRWQRRMDDLGDTALWGTVANTDGFGEFIPRRGHSKGPWSVTVTDASGVAYQRTYRSNFGGIRINKKDSH